jgi:rhomboid protease GluP
MDYNVIIFWFVAISCFSALVVSLGRLRSVGMGWAVIFLGILLIDVTGALRKQDGLIDLSLGLWLLLVLLPGLLGKLFYRLSLQQRYSAARRIARLISWLHPLDGWRDQPKFVHALELAHRGELAAAVEVLESYKQVKSLNGIVAVTHLYRLTNRWEELLAWEKERGVGLSRYSQLLPTLLRARGETGDVRGLADLYEAQKHRIAKLGPSALRDVCRLMLFVFCGKRDLAERLLSGGLAVLPPSARKFWLATADLSAGETESARRQFEALLLNADPPLRLAVERRLSRISVRVEPLDATAERIVQSATIEHGHEENFGARPSLFSKQARGTQLLIALNVAMFALEMYGGGATNGETLYRLGALYPPAVRSGEVWRLIAANFLHYGGLHLGMNMFALWVLGPFTEFALGFRKFIFVYLITGIGSMACVMVFAAEQLTVGASGSVMGLIGATAALMLRGWRREKAFVAKRRLLGMVMIVAMQSVFDAVVPQVSMTAHLSGVAIGFALTMFLRDRLSSRSGP